MGVTIFLCISLYLLHGVFGHAYYDYQLCDRNNTISTRSCTTQILGKELAHLDSCKVEYISSNSTVCKENFGPITYNGHIGGVSLRPYILPVGRHDERVSYTVNYTVLNMTFTNIKWKTMKFRFQYKNGEGHCRNIAISNDVKIDDQSVLYYDCYWAVTDGNYSGHVLDFEATDDVVVYRGRFFFNIPSAQMLSPTVTEQDWLPFTYIEIKSSKMVLHILPPPKPLKITAYKIQVIWKESEGAKNYVVQKNETIKVKNITQEVTSEYSLLKEPGLCSFLVFPIHEGCKDDLQACLSVESPKISIIPEIHQQTLNICIASIASLIVGGLFAYYIVLVVIRRYWCKDYSLTVGNEIPPPPNVLVIYPSANRLHAECVASLVNYLRSECGFDVMYDGDIAATSHGDPFKWASEAMKQATHIVYIVGPAEETNLYNSIYDKPIITPYKDIDILLLSLLRNTRMSQCRKDVMNVFFEHSNGELPAETKHDKVYFLLKDWQKLISHLSRHLLPKKQIMRTERGRSFLEDLTRAKKLLSDKKDDVIVRCEKIGNIEKKVLL